MIPDKRLLYIISLFIGLAILGAIWPQFNNTVYIAGLSVLLLSTIDLIRLTQTDTLTLTRTVNHVMPVDSWQDVELILKHQQRGLTVTVFDMLTSEFEFESLPQQITIDANQQGKMIYRIKPLKRGDSQLTACQIQVHSPLQLWRQRRTLDVHTPIKVFPDYMPVIEYAILAADRRINMMGIHQRRLRGEGMDFLQLREYREGDSLRQIDWKATARLNKAISKEYQQETDQDFIFLVDCGQRMRIRDDQLSHFDHCLNAVLLTSYVALKQGDAVGIATFSGDVRWQPPIKGASQLKKILHTVYDIQPGHDAPDYLSAAQAFIRKHRKRAVVIIITNIREEDNDELLAAVSLLKKKHRVIVASMKEQMIVDYLQQNPTSFEQTLTTAATHLYLNQRKTNIEKLQKYGAHILDVTPNELPVSLVNRYLALKAS